MLLRRVVDEHPATPWALLAQRELENPLGFKWTETYVPPRPRMNDAEAAKQKKRHESTQATGRTQTIIVAELMGRQLIRGVPRFSVEPRSVCRWLRATTKVADSTALASRVHAVKFESKSVVRWTRDG